MRTPSITELHRWLEYWQQSLRLRDWRVTLRYGSFDPSDSVGRCIHNQHHRSATIELLDPQYYQGDDNPEQVLVHELLHLLFAPFEYKVRESPEGIAQEQAINMIAGSLVRERRRVR